MQGNLNNAVMKCTFFTCDLERQINKPDISGALVTCSDTIVETFQSQKVRKLKTPLLCRSICSGLGAECVLGTLQGEIRAMEAAVHIQ